MFQTPDEREYTYIVFSDKGVPVAAYYDPVQAMDAISGPLVRGSWYVKVVPYER